MAGVPKPRVGVADEPKPPPNGEGAKAPRAVAGGAPGVLAVPRAGAEPKRLPPQAVPPKPGALAGWGPKAPPATEPTGGGAAAGASPKPERPVTGVHHELAPEGVAAGAAVMARAAERGMRGWAGGLYLSRTEASRLRAAASGSYPRSCRRRARWVSMRAYWDCSLPAARWKRRCWASSSKDSSSDVGASPPPVSPALTPGLKPASPQPRESFLLEGVPPPAPVCTAPL
mmetsp:Transcript_3426/g.10758  ORF Transcript_3426/g.10758 Transcript_3426/m.10758 type:complete len:229 (+) Transcript_3426:267-953(+)